MRLKAHLSVSGKVCPVKVIARDDKAARRDSQSGSSLHNDSFSRAELVAKAKSPDRTAGGNDFAHLVLFAGEQILIWTDKLGIIRWQRRRAQVPKNRITKRQSL